MKFYDILQIDAQANKNLMNNCSTKSEKNKFAIGLFLRSILIVVFAILFISTLSTLFGSENNPMAVVIFCVLLSVRFVDFGYCIKDELINLTIVFWILLISPVVASSIFPFGGFCINLVSLLIILLITCDKPEMGNGGLFCFSYIYLCGNPVYGEGLIQRFYLTLVSLIICGLVFYFKHKDKNKDIRFIDKVKEFKITEFKYQWILKLTVGISLILFIGMALNIERFMWAGFAYSSLLSIYSPQPNIKERFIQRIIGVMQGVIVFFLIYNILPLEMHGIIGPLGGFCLGFCIDYKHKTAMNSLGALFIATEIYGLQYSIILRITNTTIGLIFGIAFLYIYEKYVSRNIVNI